MRLFLLAFLSSLPVYLLTLAPTVTGEDSGELVTAAWSLGIPHPPGYPLWCLLGKLFTLVIPLGDVAYRVNLLSAVLAASSAGALALLVERVLVRAGHRTQVVPLATALLFAFSRDFWAQSTIAEVYSLNILLLSLALLAVVTWDEKRELRYLYFFSILWGLALTNHTTMLPLGAVMAGYVILRAPSLALKPTFLLTAVGFVLAGLSIFAYLPIRSLADPAMDWGNPEGLGAFLDHVLRRQYAGVEAPGERTLANQLALTLNFAKDFASQFTPFIVPFVLLGIWRQLCRDLPLFLLNFALFLLASYGIIWFFNYPAVREDLVIKRTFYLPAYAIATPWLGLGIAGAAAQVGRLLGATVARAPNFRPALVPALSLLLPMFPLAFHFGENDRSRYYFVRDFARNILTTLPEDSIIVPSSDHTTFPLIYLIEVEGLRPDVTIADRYGYIEPDVLSALPQRAASAELPQNDDREAELRYLLEHAGRPVFFTVKCDFQDIGYSVVPYGLVYRAVPVGEKLEPSEVDSVWSRFHWEDGTFSERPRDYTADMILSDSYFAVARYLFERDRSTAALEAIREAAKHGWGIKEVLNNLGGYLSEKGHSKEAIPYLRAAWDIEPGYVVACRNLSIAYFQEGKYSAGLYWFELRIKNGEADRLTLLGAARGAKELGFKYQASGYYLRLARSDWIDLETLDEAIAFLESLEEIPETIVAELKARREKQEKSREGRDPFDESTPPGTELLPEHIVRHFGSDLLPAVSSSAGPRGFVGSEEFRKFALEKK